MLLGRNAHADPEAAARQARLDLPVILPRIVQRRNTRLCCFLDDENRQRYLPCCAKRCLAHLLSEVTVLASIAAFYRRLRSVRENAPRRAQRPRLRADDQSRASIDDIGCHRGDRPGHSIAGPTLRALCQRPLARYWYVRYKSSLIDRETYLLHCYRNIALNSVRARMTADPIDHAWFEPHMQRLQLPRPTHSPPFHLSRNLSDFGRPAPGAGHDRRRTMCHLPRPRYGTFPTNDSTTSALILNADMPWVLTDSAWLSKHSCRAVQDPRKLVAHEKPHPPSEHTSEQCTLPLFRT